MIDDADLALRDLARESVLAWGSVTAWSRFEAPAHVVLIAELLERAAREGNARLLISVPPRHGKSTLCSALFPSWFVGRHPSKRVLLASYEATFASSWSRRARDLLAEHGPGVFGVGPREDVSSASVWETAEGGGMVAVGVGGALTGRGADVLLVDDPIKNAEEALSTLQRERAWDWWQSTAMTRLEPGGSAIVVATRWHEDDLIGRLEREGGWRVVRLAALAEPGDPLGRSPGEALWPDRYDENVLASLRRRAGRWWDAIYQGHPSPLEGSMFRRHWWTGPAYTSPSPGVVQARDLPPVRVDAIPTFGAADTALSTKTFADRTAIAVVGHAQGKLWLLDMIVGRWEAPDTVAKFREVCARWRIPVLGVESAGGGLAVLQEARRAGLPVRALEADKDKVSRALALSTMLEQGRFMFPREAPWLAGLEAELLGFPVGQHDDQVDALAYAAIMAGSMLGARPLGIGGPSDARPSRSPISSMLEGSARPW